MNRVCYVNNDARFRVVFIHLIRIKLYNSMFPLNHIITLSLTDQNGFSFLRSLIIVLTQSVKSKYTPSLLYFSVLISHIYTLLGKIIVIVRCFLNVPHIYAMYGKLIVIVGCF